MGQSQLKSEQAVVVCYDENEMHQAIVNELGMHFSEWELGEGYRDQFADALIMRMRRDCTELHCEKFRK